VSLINYDFWKKLKLDKKISGGGNIKTISGISRSEGMITLPVTIFGITRKFTLFIVKSEAFTEDILLGLDCIKEFKLCQDENLRISRSKSVDKPMKVNENRVNNLNKHTDDRVQNILKKYDNIFARSKFDVGAVLDYEAIIKLTENRYVSKKPYKCSINDKKEIENQIEGLLKAGLIEESCSPYGAPVTLVYKKEDGRKSRLCIDYRELNKIVVPESQPFPRMDDLKLRARNCRYFSKLDVNSAFWSIPLQKKDRHKTAFVTHHGHWQWSCLPFGLKSSPAIFQRVLASILRKNSLNSFAVNYIDDILIYSENYSDHIKHIEMTLVALKKQGFKLNLSKCKFLHKIKRHT